MHILFSCTVAHRASSIFHFFFIYISPRSLSFLSYKFYLLLCIPPIVQVIFFYLLGNIKYRVCLLASGQPIFRGSSQRENEERFTTSVSFLSYRILLTESGHRIDFLSGTLTFPYPLVGPHCTNYFVSLWCCAASTDYAGIKSSTSLIVPNTI